MLFQTPKLDSEEVDVVAEVRALHESLGRSLREPRRWVGSLRRDSMARAIQGSNSIEGFHATLDDAAAVDLGEQTVDAEPETTLALRGYREAMTYVMQIADDEDFEFHEQLLKSLHFMMVGYDLSARPGRWRAGAIFVERTQTRDIVYEGAPVDEVPALMGELVSALNTSETGESIVDGAMAHLNLVMIHPFRDGNGRMARCLQTLVLALQGMRNPVFSSVEEYLGANTERYYNVLAEVGGGRWQPDRSSTPWVRFMLTAHLRQGRTMERRIADAERLWLELDALMEKNGLLDRTFNALWDAATGYRVRNATYRAQVKPDGEITETTASRDLRLLADLGFLRPVGERRGRHYVGGAPLVALRHAATRRTSRSETIDPFRLK